MKQVVVKSTYKTNSIAKLIEFLEGMGLPENVVKELQRDGATQMETLANGGVLVTEIHIEAQKLRVV